MSNENFRRLSWFWFAFPGNARVAFRYEKFLNGLLEQFPLLTSDYQVRVKPTELPP